GNLDGEIKAEVSTGQGQVSNIVSQPNPETGGMRVHFELDPAGSPLAELRARLVKGSEPVAGTWLYRGAGGCLGSVPTRHRLCRRTRCSCRSNRRFPCRHRISPSGPLDPPSRDGAPAAR